MTWEIDGVACASRFGGGPDQFHRLIGALRQTWETRVGDGVKAIFLDDKNCAYYEVMLADGLPRDLADLMAADIVAVFRSCGGYNGLIVSDPRYGVLRNEDPWWAGDLDDADAIAR